VEKDEKNTTCSITVTMLCLCCVIGRMKRFFWRNYLCCNCTAVCREFLSVWGQNEWSLLAESIFFFKKATRMRLYCFPPTALMQKFSSIIVQFFEERVGHHYLAVLLHQSTHEERIWKKYIFRMLVANVTKSWRAMLFLSHTTEVDECSLQSSAVVQPSHQPPLLPLCIGKYSNQKCNTSLFLWFTISITQCYHHG